MGKEFDKCDIVCVNHQAVERVKAEMVDQLYIQRIADVFKVLGDANRAKIIHYLSKEELCVCDISQLLGMSISAVSHQLRVLRDRSLVKFRREGKIVYYSLDDQHIVNLFSECLEHVKHD